MENKILNWIIKHFPEYYPEIKKRCVQLDELDDFDEKMFYLNDQYSMLIYLLKKKLDNKLVNLLNSLDEQLSKSEFNKIKEKLDDIENIEKKINILKDILFGYYLIV